jgi:hypothetical protein
MYKIEVQHSVGGSAGGDVVKTISPGFVYSRALLRRGLDLLEMNKESQFKMCYQNLCGTKFKM